MISNNKYSLIKFHILLNIIIIIFITGPNYIHTPINGFLDMALWFIHLCILQLTLYGFLLLLNLNKQIFKISFIIFFTVFANIGFYKYTQDISINSVLIQAVADNWHLHLFDMVNTYSILFNIVIGSLLYLIISINDSLPPQNPILSLTIPLLCIILLFFTEYFYPNTLRNRIPYNIINSLIEYSSKSNFRLNTANIPEIYCKEDSLIMVFVLGESVRADHLQINGYKRDTTPLLSNNNNIISFRNLYTENTYTGISVPQI